MDAIQARNGFVGIGPRQGEQATLADIPPRFHMMPLEAKPPLALQGISRYRRSQLPLCVVAQDLPERHPGVIRKPKESYNFQNL